MATKSTADEKSLTCEQCRAADRYAIEQLGIPGVVLMENAGRNAAELIEGWVRRRLRERVERRAASGERGKRESDIGKSHTLVSMVCGKGNNGGDGFVIARHLAIRGWAVAVDLVAAPASLAGDAAINYGIIERMGVPIRQLADPAALDEAVTRWRQSVAIVDALLGTGFTGEVREPPSGGLTKRRTPPLAGIIERINSLRANPRVTGRSVPLAACPPVQTLAGKLPVAQTHNASASPRATGGLSASADPDVQPAAPWIIAVDVPSGLDADTGTAAGSAVRADYTVTFLANKVGYQNKTARAYLGRVVVCDIGAPLGLILERLRLA